MITLCSGKIVTLNFVFKKKFDLLMVYCVVEDHVLTLIKHRKMCHFQSILSKLWILKKYSWKYYSVKRIKLYYLTDFGEIFCVHSCYRVNNKIIIVFYAKLYWTSFLLPLKNWSISKSYLYSNFYLISILLAPKWSVIKNEQICQTEFWSESSQKYWFLRVFF